MRYFILFAAAGFAGIAACATDALDAPPPLEIRPDANAPAPQDAGASDAASDADDAEVPLVCGEAGYCETRLPKPDVGSYLLLRSVWAVAPNDVWSVSAEGFVVHYDGTSWATAYRAGHALVSVWATASEVWAGGEDGLLLHRDAAGLWMRTETNHLKTILAIYGTASNDVWFTSRDGSVDHFDGSALTNHPLGAPGVVIKTFFGSAAAGMFAAGYVQARPTSATARLAHIPHLFTISTARISVFNSQLSGQEGFVPAAGTVAEDDDAGTRVFLAGYTESPTDTALQYCTLSRDSMVPPASLGGHGAATTKSAERPVPAAVPLWARSFDDIWVPYRIGAVSHWNGSAFDSRSLRMGYRFVPRAIYSMHGTGDEAWIVGDGFALKGNPR